MEKARASLFYLIRIEGLRAARGADRAIEASGDGRSREVAAVVVAAGAF